MSTALLIHKVASIYYPTFDTKSNASDIHDFRAQPFQQSDQYDDYARLVTLNLSIMLQPFQCLLYCPKSGTQQPDILLAASGHSIFSFDVQSGSLLSTWPSPPKRSLEIGDPGNRDAERQSKRQKASISREASHSDSADIVVENDLDIDSSANKNGGSTGNIAKLICTSDSKHVVAVTAEDKSIRVFEQAADGSLTQISVRYDLKSLSSFGFSTDPPSRSMPKRPCTIALTPDNSTIICGDKFGDVYSLPLLGKVCESERSEILESDHKNSIEQPQKPFTPAASSRTVHTKKNQEALRNQQKQLNSKPKERVVQFEHQLLLGHVSLLTDLAYVRLDKDDSPSGRSRDYIITSDRDEHIRVSRGIPQAYVTEGFCLGHTEFISKICAPHRKRRLLVSGGGDDFLLVWDWISGALRQKLDLRTHVIELGDPEGLRNNSVTNFAVSGIWDISNSKPNAQKADIVVACEAYVPLPQFDHFKPCTDLGYPRIPAIFLFSFNETSELIWYDTVRAKSNVIDVAFMESYSGLIYSMDTFHQAGTTTTTLRKEEKASRHSIGVHKFNRCSSSEGNQSTLSTLATAISESARTLACSGGSGDEVSLYNLESLRKRGQEE